MKKADVKYLSTVVDPIRVCAMYKPNFGKGVGSGLSLAQFQELYQQDPLYNWFGLDNPRIDTPRV